MDLQLNGKIAIVTGSSAGIGLATAKALYDNGASVILNGRYVDRLKEVKSVFEQDKSAHGSVDVVEADLGTHEGAQKLIDYAPVCDILVNNLGTYFPKDFMETTDEEWDHIWQVNVMSGVRLSRHYLKGMLERKWGRIIFVSSESALQIPVEMIHYGVTKTAQIAVARGIAEKTIGTNVTSNSVLVGPTYSEGVKNFVEDLAKCRQTSKEQVEQHFFKETRPTSLLQRFISPEEVGSFIAYLSSERSSAINGSALRIDGGVLKSAI